MYVNNYHHAAVHYHLAKLPHIAMCISVVHNMLWLYRDLFLFQTNNVISAATIVITITIIAPTAMPIYPYFSLSSSSSSSLSSSVPPFKPLPPGIVKQNHIMS